MKLRQDVLIVRNLEYARMDIDEAARERDIYVRLGMRSRAKRNVKFARMRLHRLMRDKRAQS